MMSGLDWSIASSSSSNETPEWVKDPSSTNTKSTINTRDLCLLASNSFKSKNYQACSALYTKMMNEKVASHPLTPDAYRLQHNILVANFLRDGCVKSDEFYRELKKLILEAGVDTSWKNSKYIEEPIFCYNLAVLYFHHKQYQNAFKVLQKLSHDLCPATNLFAARVNLLLIEVLVKLQRFKDAMGEIDCLGKQVTYPERPVDDAEDEGIDLESEKEKRLDKQAELEIMERLKHLKIICLLGMSEFSSARRECKSLISVSGDSKQSMLIAAHLKAQQEFLTGNSRKARKILANLKEANDNNFWHTGDHLDLILANNIGCLHFAMRNPNVACTYFANAAAYCDELQYKDKSQVPVYCRAYNKKYEILYNLGVAMLQLDQPPQQAYLHLSLCRKPYFSNPRLWLRIAECCIKIYLEGQGKTWKQKNEKILHFLKEDVTNRMNSVPSLFQRCQSETELLDLPPGIPQPTLTYASDCIAIALKLMDIERARRGRDASPGSNTLNVNPSHPITSEEEISRLYANILCVGAYISAILHKYNLSLNYCKRILQMPDVPSHISYYANMYLGEIFFKMSKAEESFKYLSGTKSISTTNTDKDMDMTSQVPIMVSELTDIFEPEAAMKYNQCVVLLTTGNLEAARQHLEVWILKIAPKSPPPEMLILLIEIYAKQGNFEQAKAIAQKIPTCCET